MINVFENTGVLLMFEGLPLKVDQYPLGSCNSGIEYTYFLQRMMPEMKHCKTVNQQSQFFDTLEYGLVWFETMVRESIIKTLVIL